MKWMQSLNSQVTPNLYGNIVANVVAGLTGGPGIMPGANVGNQVAVFEQGARHVGQDVSSLLMTDCASSAAFAKSFSTPHLPSYAHHEGIHLLMSCF